MSVTQFFDPALLNKYSTNGPRYTSYPTALEFTPDFRPQDFVQATEQTTADELSLYIHIPFCHSLCYYCGCNKIVTRHQHKADEYLKYLAKEMSLRAPLFTSKTVTQLHLGGGTPSFLSNMQMARLIGLVNKYFQLGDKLDMSIEIDPRRIDLDYLDDLHQLGFNRVSFGVQDTDALVQSAINRVQSSEFIGQLVDRAKQLGFASVNVDLIYGLPHQSEQTMARTLADVRQMDVDRISLFSYAHLPQRFAAQRKLKDEWLPDGQQKFALMKQAITTLTDYGYEFIGMDHFAKPDDELALAQRQGVLHRNFQGYTTQGHCDMLGLGVSSISAVGRCYAQNHKQLKDYYQALDEDCAPLSVGLTMSEDDVIRGDVIRELMCNLRLDFDVIERAYQIDFKRYFSASLKQLQPFVEDGMVSVGDNHILVAPKARLLVRLICMCFDAYLSKQQLNQRFSRVI